MTGEGLVDCGAQRLQFPFSADEHAAGQSIQRIEFPRVRAADRGGGRCSVCDGLQFAAHGRHVLRPPCRESFSSNRRINASRAGGMRGLCHDGATGGVLMCWPMTATVSSPRSGDVSRHLVEHGPER